MMLFTLEAGGEPIAVWGGDDMDAAAETFLCSFFKGELQKLKRPDTGTPLWDGVAPLTIRRAFPSEMRAWSHSLDLAYNLAQIEQPGPDFDWLAILGLVERNDEHDVGVWLPDVGQVEEDPEPEAGTGIGYAGEAEALAS